MTGKRVVAGEEARKQAYERQQAARARSKADLTARIIESFKKETDRDYAMAMWSDALRERGIWISSNGVEHAIDDQGRCATCGRNHYTEEKED